MQRQPRENYVIYVFHEVGGGGGGGGLGDRLGGMITALAFALRTNRQFLVLGDAPFAQAFQPYQGSDGGNRTWSDWGWANWRSEFTANMSYNRHCVNPKPRATVCALDKDSPAVKVIKFRGNRAYLCRWAIKPSLNLQPSLKQILGIDRESDLYETAGCMLRLAMWPTDRLWSILDISVAEKAPAHVYSSHVFQLSFHFRCGDSSFSTHPPVQAAAAAAAASTAVAPVTVNKECVWDPAVKWRGTNFADDFSRDSPVDLALCGLQILAKSGSGSLAYIASDYPPSAAQINATLLWPRTFIPGEACHVDLKKSNKQHTRSLNEPSSTDNCTLSTSSQWLMLALSDALVMQALEPNTAVDSPYKPKSPETANLANTPADELGPISAFSRYAAIYALGKDVMRYGNNCTRVNKKNLSWQTMGNWVCDPKMFHR